MTNDGAQSIGRGGGTEATWKKGGNEPATKNKAAASSKSRSSELRIKCRQKNAPGVRLIANEPEKSAQTVAAYLYFKTVTDFKEFVASNGMCTLFVQIKRPC
jgi:hypothetical protein